MVEKYLPQANTVKSLFIRKMEWRGRRGKKSLIFNDKLNFQVLATNTSESSEVKFLVPRAMWLMKNNLYQKNVCK